MWVLIPLGLFLLLSFAGRQVRTGRWSGGPWFKQFRVFRSVIALALAVLCVVMLARGEWWIAIAAFLGAVTLSGTVRFSGSFARPRGPATAAAYTAEEIRAYQTLGLSIGADKKAVREAWSRLMKTAHPDQGGDVARASALNAARDTLLKRRGWA